MCVYVGGKGQGEGVLHLLGLEGQGSSYFLLREKKCLRPSVILRIKIVQGLP